MSPLQHALISLVAGGPAAVVPGLAPDAGNLFLLFARTRLPESDWRVKLSRYSHSPLVVLALLVVDYRRIGRWYLLHWLCDVLTHPVYQWAWPFVRKID